MQVPFFDYKHIFNQYEKDLTSIIIDISNRGSFILQDELKSFEYNLAKYLGSKYSIGVGNCTDGLLLALKASKIGEGDEVIFCSHTFVATASAIHFSGAVPIPVECGEDHLIDVNALESAITSKTKAIIPTQLNGQICDMDAIMKICSKNNLTLIESTDNHWVEFKGKRQEHLERKLFSFYPAKNLGCFGDGGSVATNDKNIYDQILLLRDHGRSRIGEDVQWGMNSRLDNLHASIFDYKLSKYSLEVDRRRKIASMYEKGLSAISELVLPPGITSNPDKFEVYQNFEIEVKSEKDRSSLRDFCLKSNWDYFTGGKAVHEFEGLGFNYLYHLRNL